MDCFIIVPNDVERKFDIKKENTYWGVSSSVIYTENMIRVSLSEVRSLSLSLSLRGVKSDCAKLPTHGRLPLPLPPWAVKVRTNRKFIPKDLHECFARRRDRKGMAFQISVRLIKPPLLRGYSKSIRYRLILSRFYAEK